MERTKGERKKMSLAKKLIVGSGLILMAGCAKTVFEGTIGTDKVTLEKGVPIMSTGYQLTIEKQGGCKYELLVLGDNSGRVYRSKGECKTYRYNLDDSKSLQSAQNLYDKYLSKIQSEINK